MLIDPVLFYIFLYFSCLITLIVIITSYSYSYSYVATVLHSTFNLNQTLQKVRHLENKKVLSEHIKGSVTLDCVSEGGEEGGHF